MKDKIPDKRAMERMTSDLTRMLQGKNFSSKEEVDDYLKGVVRKGRIPKMPPKSAVQSAQDIMYEAWEAKDDNDRIKLAREALSVSSDCADAYVLLAEEEARTLEEGLDLYRQGVEAGERALGKKFFKEETGRFWGLLETRPYMRAREGVVWCLWNLGESEKAIEQCYEMLKLNPNDNQGMRHTLICYLADLQRYDELDRFLNHGDYNDDAGTEWHYTRVLVSFVKKGDAPETRDALKAALEGNAHVPDYLVGKKRIPGQIPDFVTWGGEDEAIGYADNFISAWQKVPEAIEWLKEQVGIRTVAKVGRNEACPCGSGKKYKKCCGK